MEVPGWFGWSGWFGYSSVAGWASVWQVNALFVRIFPPPLRTVAPGEKSKRCPVAYIFSPPLRTLAPGEKCKQPLAEISRLADWWI